MDNKYVLMIMGSISLVIWFFVGVTYFAGDMGGMHPDYWLVAILATALGAGSTGGTCAMSIAVEGVKGYINTLIMLVIVALVGHNVIALGLRGEAFDMMGTLLIVEIFVVSSLFWNLTVSYLKKAL